MCIRKYVHTAINLRFSCENCQKNFYVKVLNVFKIDLRRIISSTVVKLPFDKSVHAFLELCL